MCVRFNSTQATGYRDGTAVNKAPALSQVSGAQTKMSQMACQQTGNPQWVEPTYHTDISAKIDWLPKRDHVQYSAWNPRPRDE